MVMSTKKEKNGNAYTMNHRIKSICKSGSEFTINLIARFWIASSDCKRMLGDPKVLFRGQEVK